jgi:predicted nucleotidyltransferase
MGLASIDLPAKQIERFCQKHHIRRLAFFGSVVRDDFGPQSDIDVLVEFNPGHTPGFDFFLMEAELSRILGRKVELQTEKFISPEIRRSTLTEAVTAYEQARS